MAEPVIKIEDLWWRYEGSKDWALKGINLTIERGEFVGIVGPNESGKTTLAMAMNGLIPNNYRGVMKGRVISVGMDTREHSTAEIARKVGFVFSDPESQFLTMTVEEELAFGLENMGLPVEEIRDRIRWAMEITRLNEEFLEKPPYELSGGQKQRVAIAAVLAMKPDVIILDEPTSMLDPVGKTEVFDVLVQLRKSYNATIIVVEHRLEDIAYLADKMVLLYYGKVLKVAPPREFFDDIPFLLKHYVYPPEIMIAVHRLREEGLYNGPIPLRFEEGVKIIEEVLKG